MRIAVTGARGRLGTAVTRTAVAAGHEVVAMDRAGTGPGPDHPGVPTAAAVTHLDVAMADLAALQAGVDGSDAVVHLAAIPSPRGRDEPEVHHNNVIASYNALTAAAAAGIDRVCLASSINAIGGAYSRRPRYDYLPLDENHPTYTEEPYGLSKWIAEAQAADFARRHASAAVVCLRLHALVRDAAQLRSVAAAHPDPAAFRLDLFGYTALDDAARACLAALAVGPTGCHVVYLVAPRTRVDVPSMVLRDTFYPQVPVVGDLSGTRGFFDCSRAVELLGFSPTVL